MLMERRSSSGRSILRSNQHCGEINTRMLDDAWEQLTRSYADTYPQELERYQQSPAPRVRRGDTPKRRRKHVREVKPVRAWWNDI